MLAEAEDRATRADDPVSALQDAYTIQELQAALTMTEPVGATRASTSRKAAAKATADKYIKDRTGKSAAKKMLTPSVMKSRADKYVAKDGSKVVIAEATKTLIKAAKEYSGTADSIREEWLRKAAKMMHSWFAVAGYDMPAYRVSVGWTSKGVRTKRIGECWDKSVSADGSYQIFISPTQADTTMVLGILAHELVHAVVGIAAKHGPKFKRCAIDACGFEGKAAHMCTGARFLEQVKPIIDKLGEFPHSAMKPGKSSTGEKQPTRMIKCECPKCGYIARTTEKWLQFGAPVCPTHLKEMKVRM
jgi:hypothetical protein